jgi:hypothetical protein
MEFAPHDAGCLNSESEKKLLLQRSHTTTMATSRKRQSMVPRRRIRGTTPIVSAHSGQEARRPLLHTTRLGREFCRPALPPQLCILSSGTRSRATGQDQQRFLSDPQQMNSASYARDNPITNKDPNGNTFAAAIGLVSAHGF